MTGCAGCWWWRRRPQQLFEHRCVVAALFFFFFFFIYTCRAPRVLRPDCGTVPCMHMVTLGMYSEGKLLPRCSAVCCVHGVLGRCTLLLMTDRTVAGRGPRAGGCMVQRPRTRPCPGWGLRCFINNRQCRGAMYILRLYVALTAACNAISLGCNVPVPNAVRLLAEYTSA